MTDQPSAPDEAAGPTMAGYNPTILANLIVGLFFAAGNLAVVLLPLSDGVTIGVMGVANSAGLLVAFLATGALAQSRTVPIDPATGVPLNPDYQQRRAAG